MRSPLQRPASPETSIWNRLFPGSRVVWLGAAAALIVGLVLMARILDARTASTTGTNSVDVAAVVARAKPGQATCIKDLVVPARTGRVQVWLGVVEARGRPRVRAWVRGTGGSRIPLRYLPASSAGEFKTFSLQRPLTRGLENAEVCIRAQRAALDLGGASVMRLHGAAVSTIGGAPLQGVDVAVKFLRRDGDTVRVVDELTSTLSRATLFYPGTARVAIYLFALLLVLAVYPIARLAATAQNRSVGRLAAAAALLALLHACAWGLLLQPFHGPDESEHFAYVQHLAATGDRADAGRSSARPPYSSSQLRLMEAVHHNSTILNASSRLRWDEFYDEAYQRSLRTHPSDADGGGFTESATGHSPLYYAIVGLPLRLFGRSGSLPGALLVVRLFSALMGAAVAGLAVLTAARLVPGRRDIAWLAGVLVAMQPVMASVSGSVNNDSAVNLLAATLVFLLVRSWRTGFTARDAVRVGVVAILLPLAKITGFALIPIIGLAAVALGFQHGWSGVVRWLTTAAVSAAAVLLLWMFALSPLLGGGRGTLVNVHTASAAQLASTAKPAPPPAPPPPISLSVLGRAEYFVQTFVPQAPFGPRRWAIADPSRLRRWPAFAIYIDRGYGLFGWKSTSLSYGVLKLILFALTAGWALALLAAIRARRRWRSWLGGAVILGGAVVSVLAFVSFAYATDQIHTDPGEQGRYVFTALVPLAVLLAGSVAAFRGRGAQLLLGAGATGAWVIAVVAYATALRGWFT